MLSISLWPTRLLYTLLASYTLLAILYTTTYFFLRPFYRALGFPPKDSFWFTADPFLLLTPPSSHQHQDPLIHWATPGVTTPESLFLSKTFSASMRPSTIVPYFYQATGSPDVQYDDDDDDVTITTLITEDRFPVFKRLVDTYTGDLSSPFPSSSYTAVLADRVLQGQYPLRFTPPPHFFPHSSRLCTCSTRHPQHS